MSQPRGKPEEKTDSVLVIINDQQETFTHQLRVSDLLPEGSQRETQDVNGRAKLVPGSEYIYVTAQGECYFLDYYLSVVKLPTSGKMGEKVPKRDRCFCVLPHANELLNPLLAKIEGLSPEWRSLL